MNFQTVIFGSIMGLASFSTISSIANAASQPQSMGQSELESSGFGRAMYVGKYQVKRSDKNYAPLIVTLKGNGTSNVENLIIDGDGKPVGSECPGIWYLEHPSNRLRVELNGCSSVNFVNEIVFSNLFATTTSFSEGGLVDIGQLAAWGETIDDVKFTEQKLTVISKNRLE